jgi:hypothetical protein
LKKLIFIVVMLIIAGCGQKPHVDVSAKIENNQVVFNIPSSGINGILSFGVKDFNETLWSINTSYEKGNSIIYGVIPSGGKAVAKQSFPLDGKTPIDIRGKNVTVWVEYQYDSGLSPCVGTFEKNLTISE